MVRFHTNSIYQKYENGGLFNFLKAKVPCPHVAVDYEDTRFLNFKIEYLRENEKVCETVLVCSYGAQVESS